MSSVLGNVWPQAKETEPSFNSDAIYRFIESKRLEKVTNLTFKQLKQRNGDFLKFVEQLEGSSITSSIAMAYRDEFFGRGKISTIKADLDRLIQHGHISVEALNAQDYKECEASRAFLSYDLPVELQELLAKREEELCKVIRDMTTALNNKAHENYETMMAIRVRDLDAKYNLTYRAKEWAEADFSDIEERLKKQIVEKEQLEDKIEKLELKLAESRQSQSDLLQHNLQLASNLTSITDKYQSIQGTYQGINEQLSALKKEYTSMKVKLDSALSENESHRSQHCWAGC